MTSQEALEVNIAFNKALAIFRKEANIQTCFFHDHSDCSGGIIRAHSLQRQGALKVLEKDDNGNRFLYSHTERIGNEEHKFLDLKKTGRLKASTFTGFCSHHDSKIFKEIENDPEATDLDNDKHLFLHSYRSFAQGYHQKKEEINLYNSNNEEVKNLLNNLFPHGTFQEVKSSAMLGVSDLEPKKIVMDKILQSETDDELEYFTFEVPHTIPVASAATISPWCDMYGKKINRSLDPSIPLQDLIITTIPQKNRSLVILASFSFNNKIVEILDKLQHASQNVIERYLSYLSMHAENTFISPKFYDQLSIEQKKDYCDMIENSLAYSSNIVNFTSKFKLNYFDPKWAI